MKHISVGVMEVSRKNQLSLEQEMIAMEGWVDDVKDKIKSLLNKFSFNKDTLNEDMKLREETADNLIGVLTKLRSEISSKDFDTKPIHVQKYLKGLDFKGNKGRDIIRVLREKLKTMESDINADIQQLRKDPSKIKKHTEEKVAQNSTRVHFDKKEVIELVDLSIQYFRSYKSLASKTKSEFEALDKKHESKSNVPSNEDFLDIFSIFGYIAESIFQVISNILQLGLSILIVAFVLVAPIPALVTGISLLVLSKIFYWMKGNLEETDVED